jgi:hypothetical protein
VGPAAASERRPGWARLPATLVAPAIVTALLAGCGGSGLTVVSMPGGSTAGRHLSSSTLGAGVGAVRFVGSQPSPAQRAGAEVAQLKFSRCMRSHGVPSFPDPPAPSSGGYAIGFGGNGIDPAAPLFREAQRSCILVLQHRRIVAR